MVREYEFVGQGKGQFKKVPDSGRRSQVVTCMGVLVTIFVVMAILGLFTSPDSPETQQAAAYGDGPMAQPSSSPASSPEQATLYDCGPAQAPMEDIIAVSETWTEAKRSWCCVHHGRGCPAATTTFGYDCQASLGDWEAGWAEAKKAWCCERQGVGCPPSTTDAYDCSGGTDAWDFGRRYWCCWHRNAGCNEETGRDPIASTVSQVPVRHTPAKPLYDCEAGYTVWEKAWTPEKKGWCCANAGLGCGSGPSTAQSEAAPWLSPTA